MLQHSCDQAKLHWRHPPLAKTDSLLVYKAKKKKNKKQHRVVSCFKKKQQRLQSLCVIVHFLFGNPLLASPGDSLQQASERLFSQRET